RRTVAHGGPAWVDVWPVPRALAEPATSLSTYFCRRNCHAGSKIAGAPHWTPPVHRREHGVRLLTDALRTTGTYAGGDLGEHGEDQKEDGRRPSLNQIIDPPEHDGPHRRDEVADGLRHSR